MTAVTKLLTLPSRAYWALVDLWYLIMDVASRPTRALTSLLPEVRLSRESDLMLSIALVVFLGIAGAWLALQAPILVVFPLAAMAVVAITR